MTMPHGLPRWQRLALVGFLFLAVACSDQPSGPATVEDPGRSLRGPDFDTGTGTIRADGRVIRLDLEIAESSTERAFGLMHRKSLGDREGMMFLFDDKSTGGFYMKNTLIPLSIAFLDERGEILRILDMQPCKEEPCRVYNPDVAYTRALEVNQGAFARWGVTEGDVVELQR
jgi:uncharacterized membrane protein (UPF0127 family)